VRGISGLVSLGQASFPATPRSTRSFRPSRWAVEPFSPSLRTAGLWTLGAAGLAVAAVTTGAVLWRGAAKRSGAFGIGPVGLHLRCTSARPPEVDEPVSVLIPVRHEPDPTVAAVRAALGQRGVGHLDIVVLDEGCPQETRAALRQEFGDDPRVRLLSAAPLPRGWSPRAHRSHQLAVAARGRVLIFTEPSAPLGPHAAASVTALLRGEHLDLAVLDIGRPASATRGGAAVDSATSGGPAARVSAEASAKSSTNGDGHTATHGDRRSGERQRGDGQNGDSRDRERQSGDRPPHRDRAQAVQADRVQAHRVRGHGHGGGRANPGRFTVAVDADAYWRTGGYRAAADDPDPLALLRMVRRASGRVAVADGRRVIPPAQIIEPLPSADAAAEAAWDSLHSTRASLSETARRVLAALVGPRS
jgi:hypothetical protein